MKKTLFALTLALAAQSALFAQPMLQMNVIPDIGDASTLYEADSNSISPGNAGANLIWNFSNLAPLAGTQPTPYFYLAPSGTPPLYAAKFPDANFATQLDGDTVVYAYYKKEANQFSLLGLTNDFYTQEYPDADIQFKPLSYNQSFSDDFTNISDAGTGFIFYGKGTRTSTYDAYGTLTTPTGAYQNAMRVKTVTSQTDSASFFGSQIIYHYDITTYNWFAANQPGALVSINYNHTVSETRIPGFDTIVTDIGLIKSVNYISNIALGAFERPAELAGVTLDLAGANPVADDLSLQVTAEANRDLQMLITEISGRVLDTRSLSVVAGENRISLPVGHLSAGAYFLTLTDGKAVKTLNWQKY